MTYGRRISRQNRSTAPVVAAALSGALSLLSLPEHAQATPEIPLDDPRYIEAYRLQNLGLIPASALAGMRPLTSARLDELYVGAGLAPVASYHSWWFEPFDRLTSRIAVADVRGRSFSVPERTRGMLGSLDISCERQEGRPCGHGATAALELDTVGGYGNWLAAYSRLRAQAGTASDQDASLQFDRLYVNLEYKNLEAFIGRNVIGIGPGRRTQLVWGTQPPPLDHLGIAIHRLQIPSMPFALGAAYHLGWLDSPQRFSHSLVSIARAYLEIADVLSLGITNLLELGGKGAPQLSVRDFFVEHVKRTGPWPSEGVSNRRVGFDASLNVPTLRSNVYIEFVFEDWRAQFGSTLEYDTDYLIGWSASGLGPKGNHGFLVEFQRNGVRSQEHGLFHSGLTSGGRVMGTPLGPDSVAMYVSPQWDNGALSVTPWFEAARLSSDIYSLPDDGGISRISHGLAEYRFRGGLGSAALVTHDLRIEVNTFAERVSNYSYTTDKELNFGLSTALTWSPSTSSTRHPPRR